MCFDIQLHCFLNNLQRPRLNELQVSDHKFNLQLYGKDYTTRGFFFVFIFFMVRESIRRFEFNAYLPRACRMVNRINYICTYIKYHSFLNYKSTKNNNWIRLFIFKTVHCICEQSIWESSAFWINSKRDAGNIFEKTTEDYYFCEFPIFQSIEIYNVDILF